MTTPPTTDLAPIVAFIERMLDADEAAAKAAAEHRANLSSTPALGLHITHGQQAGEHWTRRYDTINATHEDGGRSGGIAYVGNFGMDLAAHIARHDPARVLAQVAALRAVVALHGRETWGTDVVAELMDEPDALVEECGECSYDARRVPFPCPTLRHIAAIWRGADGWREEWA